MNQVKQGEQKNPDQVDQVPVKAGVLEPDVVGLMDFVFSNLPKHINEQANANKYVQGVNACHDKIQPEEKDGSMAQFEKFGSPGVETILKFGAPFKVFVDKKNYGNKKGDG